MKYTEKQLASACVTYRHDFGLLSPSGQDDVRSQMAQILSHMPERESVACPTREEVAKELAEVMLASTRAAGPSGASYEAIWLSVADRALALCAGKLPAEVWGLPAKLRDRARELDALSASEHDRRSLNLAEGQAQACKLIANELETALKSTGQSSPQPASPPDALPVPGAAVRALRDNWLAYDLGTVDRQFGEDLRDALRADQLADAPKPAGGAWTRELAESLLDTMGFQFDDHHVTAAYEAGKSLFASEPIAYDADTWTPDVAERLYTMFKTIACGRPPRDDMYEAGRRVFGRLAPVASEPGAAVRAMRERFRGDFSRETLDRVGEQLDAALRADQLAVELPNAAKLGDLLREAWDEPQAGDRWLSVGSRALDLLRQHAVPKQAGGARFEITRDEADRIRDALGPGGSSALMILDTINAVLARRPAADEAEALREQLAAVTAERDQACRSLDITHMQLDEMRLQRDQARAQLVDARAEWSHLHGNSIQQIKNLEKRAQRAEDERGRARCERDEALADNAEWRAATGWETPDQAKHIREVLAARPEPVVVTPQFANRLADRFTKIANCGINGKHLHAALLAELGDRASVSVPPCTEGCRGDLASRAAQIETLTAQLREANSALATTEARHAVELDRLRASVSVPPVDIAARARHDQLLADNAGLGRERDQIRAELADCQARLKGTLALADERSADKARVEHELMEARQELGQALELADERLAHANQLQADIEAEQAGRMGLRKRYGAQEHETFGAFLVRLCEQHEGLRAAAQKVLDTSNPDTPWSPAENRLRALLKPAPADLQQSMTLQERGQLLDKLTKQELSDASVTLGPHDGLRERVERLERDNALVWRFLDRCADGFGHEPGLTLRAQEALDARKESL